MNQNILIRKCLLEESKEGWVWVPEIIGKRGSLIKIINIENKNRPYIIVSQRQIDGSYKNKYNTDKRKMKLEDNTNYLVISEYYRIKLGIDKLEKCKYYQLEIEAAGEFGFFIYLNQHPNEVVSISYRLSLFAIILSIISLLPIHDIFIWLNKVCGC